MKRFNTIVAAMALDARDATTLEHVAQIPRTAGSKTVSSSPRRPHVRLAHIGP